MRSVIALACLVCDCRDLLHLTWLVIINPGIPYYNLTKWCHGKQSKSWSSTVLLNRFSNNISTITNTICLLSCQMHYCAALTCKKNWVEALISSLMYFYSEFTLKRREHFYLSDWPLHVEKLSQSSKYWISLCSKCLDEVCLSAVRHVKSVQPMMRLSTQKSMIYYCVFCRIIRPAIRFSEKTSADLFPLHTGSARILNNTSTWDEANIHRLKILDRCENETSHFSLL